MDPLGVAVPDGVDVSDALTDAVEDWVRERVAVCVCDCEGVGDVLPDVLGLALVDGVADGLAVAVSEGLCVDVLLGVCDCVEV